MNQYHIKRKEYTERNNDLFDVTLQSDENGEIWNKRYSKDAWGRPKVSLDHSVFNATWTQSVPTRVWEEYIIDFSGAPIEVNTPQAAFTHVASTEHMLEVKSGTIANVGYSCRSKTHPRYQANKGHLYSTAIITPTPNAHALRRWGLGSDKEGVFFDLRGDGTTWDLFVIRKFNNAVVTEVSIKSKLPVTFQADKSHVYDIQFQWRGAGNFFFFIDLELIHTFDLIGTLTELSLHDPALPIDFKSICLVNGTEVIIKSGCVDISSEGGEQEKNLFGSIDTGSTLLSLGSGSGTNIALLALKIPRIINYNSESHYNSRGADIDKLVTWTRDEALTSAYVFRDIVASNLNNLTWLTIPDSKLLYLRGGDASALNTAFLIDVVGVNAIIREWADLEIKNVMVNESKTTHFNLTPGDIIVFAVAPIGANKASSATVYYSEEI